MLLSIALGDVSQKDRKPRSWFLRSPYDAFDGFVTLVTVSLCD